LEFGGEPLTSHLSLLNRKQGGLAFSVKNLALCPFPQNQGRDSSSLRSSEWQRGTVR